MKRCWAPLRSDHADGVVGDTEGISSRVRCGKQNGDQEGRTRHKRENERWWRAGCDFQGKCLDVEMSHAHTGRRHSPDQHDAGRGLSVSRAALSWTLHVAQGQDGRGKATTRPGVRSICWQRSTSSPLEVKPDRSVKESLWLSRIAACAVFEDGCEA